MPPTYLRFSSRIASQISADDVQIKYFHRRQSPACLRSWTQLNFAGKPAVNAWERLCRRWMFTYVAALSQAVPVAMSQVGRRHMRTMPLFNLFQRGCRLRFSCDLKIGQLEYNIRWSEGYWNNLLILVALAGTTENLKQEERNRYTCWKD